MNLKNKTAIVLVIFCTFLGATAQMLLKTGTNRLFEFGINIISIVDNYWLLLGYFAYGISAFLLIIALSKGELSVLYPILAATYIWVTFLSPLFFSTDYINLLKIVGIFFIFFGVSFIGLSNKK